MSKDRSQNTLLDALYRVFLARYDAEGDKHDKLVVDGDELNALTHRGRLRIMASIDDEFQEIARDELRLQQRKFSLGRRVDIVLSEWK